MPADDRDPKFERALAQHLRGDSAGACPDAETLAAYQERSLSLEEMAHWKQHISGCAACQETLALVETTEKQLKEDWENKEIPVFAAAGQPPAAMRSLAAVNEEAPAEQTPAARVAAPVEIAWRPRPALLRWAIPVGAAAAGVLLWIGFHEQRASQPSKSAIVQMTKNLPAPVPAPEQKLNDGGQTAPPMERDSLGGKFNEKSSRAREYTGAETQFGSPGAPLAKPQAHAKDAEDTKKEAGSRRADTFTYNAAPPPPPARVLQQPKAPSPSSTTQSVEVSAAAPAVTSEPSAKTNDGAAGGVVGGATGAGIANETVELESKSEARKKERATPRQQGANDLDAASAMMMKQGMTNRNVNALSALAPLPAVILTPDHRVWWRLGPGGTLELTADSGKTWKPVSAGANAQLTTGSAPSSKICWIAGKAGTLVLTTDRGTHWKVLTTPITGDLGGVSAKDAKHASIWDAARQQSFETSDGGANWKPAAP